MKRIAIYVSTSSRQKPNKEFLIHQRKMLMRYAMTVLNTKNVHVFQDIGASSTKMKSKPMLRQLINRIHNYEFSHLLVYSIDRISRNAKEYVEFRKELEDYKVTIISLKKRSTFYE